MSDHNAPTWENQLWHARKLLAEKGREALNNPHAMIGRTCGCGECFCCAAREVLRQYDAEQRARDTGKTYAVSGMGHHTGHMEAY